MRWADSSESQRSCQSLFTHNLDNHSLVPLPIEFRIEDALPRAEIELACRDWDDDFVMDEQSLQMRIAVSLAGIVVAVIFAKGRELFQPLVDVLD